MYFILVFILSLLICIKYVFGKGLRDAHAHFQRTTRSFISGHELGLLGPVLGVKQPGPLSLRMEEQIKCFPDKAKLEEFIITKPLLHEMLKGLM